MPVSEGQVSDFKGTAPMKPVLPTTKMMLVNKGNDAEGYRAALANRGITAFIPSKANPNLQLPRDRTLNRQRHRDESTFGKLKGWRRLHTLYDHGAHTFIAAICIAATVIF